MSILAKFIKSDLTKTQKLYLPKVHFAKINSEKDILTHKVKKTIIHL